MTTAQVLQQFRKLRIVVVGDIMLDHYVWGDTHRISPEAPVPVVEVLQESEAAGGAANVAINLATLGVRTEVCGVIGRDPAGDRLRSILESRDIQFDERFISPAASTILKTRIMVRRQQLCRLDRESTPANYAIREDELARAIIDKLRSADALILSDYAKGVLTQSLAEQLGTAAREFGVLLSWDPKPRRHLRVPGVTFLTPNRQEAFELAGIPETRDNFPAEEIGQRILNQYKARFLCVTMGAEGMILYQASGDHHHLPTVAREVFDVSGAGDTVVAVLTAGLAAGLDLHAAAQLANFAAGVVVGKVGTATVSPEELLRASTPHA